MYLCSRQNDVYENNTLVINILKKQSAMAYKNPKTSKSTIVQTVEVF